MQIGNTNASKNKRNGLGALAAIGLAGALFGAQPAQAVMEGMTEEFRKGSFSGGLGATNYTDDNSPHSAFTADLHFDRAVMPNFSVEGSIASAFSEDDAEDQTVIPLLLDAAVKANSAQYRGNTSLFATAGVGYGAYFGTEELQDGATFATPISGGVEIEAGKALIMPRVTWRPVYGDELGQDNVDADTWSAVLDVGLPFL